MQHSPAKLRSDATRIWLAGVDAVRPQRLVPQWLRVEGRTLIVGNSPLDSALRLPLDQIRRIAVVGGGKAAAGMARAVEAVLGPELMAEKGSSAGSTCRPIAPSAPAASTCTPPGPPG